MKITSVSVTAGRTFNHPYESYSNFKHDVHLVAAVEEGEDGLAVAKDLQAKAEKLAEEHKQNLLQSVRELAEMTEIQREVSNLEESLKRGQERLETIRRQRPSAFKQLDAGTDANLVQ